MATPPLMPSGPTPSGPAPAVPIPAEFPAATGAAQPLALNYHSVQLNYEPAAEPEQAKGHLGLIQAVAALLLGIAVATQMVIRSCAPDLGRRLGFLFRPYHSGGFIVVLCLAMLAYTLSVWGARRRANPELLLLARVSAVGWVPVAVVAELVHGTHPIQVIAGTLMGLVLCGGIVAIFVFATLPLKPRRRRSH